MPKLSLAIATYNEQANISRCLESVSGLVDEIVAVDGSSSDQTVPILKNYGAKVIITDNPVNFHINKNKAIDKCSGDWILQLDADEQVSPDLGQEIKKVLSEKKTDIKGYWLPRKNLFLGRFLKKGGQYPDYTLRLYQKGFGRLPEKSVHEQAEVKGKTVYLHNPLIHFAYPDFSHYLKHFNLYTSFFAGQMKQDNISLGLASSFDYLLVKPFFWFFKTYFLHKGFMDGFPGFVFSAFSSLRFPVSFIKYWEAKKSK